MHLTSADRSGVPSWKRTPGRSVKVYVSPSGETVGIVAGGSGLVAPGGQSYTLVRRNTVSRVVTVRVERLTCWLTMGGGSDLASNIEQGQDRREVGRGAAVAALIWAVVAAAVIGTWLAARRWWLPPLASEQGAQVDRLFTVVFSIISVVFILVQGALGLAVLRFGSRGEGHRAAFWHENRRLEAAWTAIPAVILVALTVLGGSIWLRVHSAPPPDAAAVEVVAEQFGWRFHYPGPDGVLAPIDFTADTRATPLGIRRDGPGAADDFVTRELYLVVNRPVRLLIRSKDVIHSFYVPHFRFKQDAVPGRVTQVYFTPTRTGTFPIACAELCGVGHYVMASTLKVVTPEEYEAWVASQLAR